MVWPHFSPQQPGQDSAPGNSRGLAESAEDRLNNGPTTKKNGPDWTAQP